MHFDTRLCGMCTSRKSPAFHPFECHRFLSLLLRCPPEFCSHTVAPTLGSCQCPLNRETYDSGFQKALICALYWWPLEYFRWYVSNVASSVHMALFALAGCRAFPSPSWRKSLAWAEWWLRWGQKEVWSTDCLELSLDLKLVLVCCFRGGQMCALEVCCLTKTSLSWIKSHLWILKLAFQAYTSQPDLARRPDPRWRCPLSSLAVANPTPPLLWERGGSSASSATYRPSAQTSR